MEGPVVQRHPAVNYSIARQYAPGQGLFQTLFHRWYVLSGYSAAYNLVNELEAPSAGQGVELYVHLTVLPSASGLLLVFVIGVCMSGNCLFIRYLRLVSAHLHLKPPLEAADHYVQMQGACAGYNHFTGLCVPVYLKSLFFFLKFL